MKKSSLISLVLCLFTANFANAADTIAKQCLNISGTYQYAGTQSCQMDVAGHYPSTDPRFGEFGAVIWLTEPTEVRITQDGCESFKVEVAAPSKAVTVTMTGKNWKVKKNSITWKDKTAGFCVPPFFWCEKPFNPHEEIRELTLAEDGSGTLLNHGYLKDDGTVLLDVTCPLIRVK